MPMTMLKVSKEDTHVFTHNFLNIHMEIIHSAKSLEKAREFGLFNHQIWSMSEASKLDQ